MDIEQDIDVRHHYIREKVSNVIMELKYILSDSRWFNEGSSSGTYFLRV